MISKDCANYEMIVLLSFVVIVLLIFAIFIWINFRRILSAYSDCYIKLTIIKDNYDFNEVINQQDIMKKLCPYDLIDVNNRHLYKTSKCSACHRQCKQVCWKSYFIEKRKENKYG